MLRTITGTLSLTCSFLVILGGILYFFNAININSGTLLILVGINLVLLGTMFSTFNENEVGEIAKPVGVASILIGVGIVLLVILVWAGLI